MIEELKDRTIVSWGGYEYFKRNLGKLENIEIAYICGVRDAVAVVRHFSRSLTAWEEHMD